MINIKRVTANPVAKNILLLFSGTGLSQLIPFIAMLLLSRLYTAADFGNLALVMSISGIIATIAALRYELIIVMQRKTSEAKTAMSLSFSLIAVVCILTLLLLFLLRPLLIPHLKISSYELLFAVPVIVAGIGVFTVFDNWFNRQRDYKNMALIKVVQSSTGAIAKLLLGAVGISWGLIGGTIIGYAAAVFICIFLFFAKETFSYKYFFFAKMKQLAVSYQDFAKFATPAGLLNTTTIAGLPILITYFYSVELAGIYFFANSLIRVPIALIANSTAQVFKAEAVTLIKNRQIESLKKLISKVQKTVFGLIFPIVLILSLFGSSIFAFVFGEQWVASGNLIKYFGFYLLFGTNYSIISALADILRLQKMELLFNFSLLFSQIIVFAVCSIFLSFEYALLAIFAIGSLHFLVIDRYVKKKLR